MHWIQNCSKQQGCHHHHCGTMALDLRMEITLLSFSLQSLLIQSHPPGKALEGEFLTYTSRCISPYPMHHRSGVLMFPRQKTLLSYLTFVQGGLKEKNFDIRKTAGGKSYVAVYKKYNATVSKNFLEIHLFWAGKGTCCIPTQGYYGPMISALSVTPSTV